MVSMNDEVVKNSFTNADIAQWFKNLTTFVLEFFNLVSDIILYAIGMKGKFLSRFACYSKDTSADNMSNGSGEHVIEANSLKATNKSRCRSVSESDVHIELEQERTGEKISRNNNGGGDKETPRSSKSRIPRLVSLCGKQPNTNTMVHYEDPMELIKAFNKFVRDNNYRHNYKKLFKWIPVFNWTIFNFEQKYENKTVDVLMRNQLNAIKKKREELIDILDIEKLMPPDKGGKPKPKGFQRMIDTVSCCKDRRSQYGLSQSGGDTGSGSKEKLTVKKSPSKVGINGRITSEVYPRIEKLRDRKLTSIGDGEVMDIASKEFYEVRKITPGEPAPDRSAYRELYPLSLTKSDVLVRTVITIYCIGKDKNNLQFMHEETHTCEPVSFRCSVCQKLRERGYLSATEVKAMMFKNCHSVLEQKCRAPDSAFLDEMMAKPSQKVAENIGDQTITVVELTASTTAASKVTKSPFKGGRCSSKDTRIAKGLAQPKTPTPGPKKIENTTNRKGDVVNYVVNQFGKAIPTSVQPSSPKILPPTTPIKQETLMTSPTTQVTSPTTPSVPESPQKDIETSVSTKGKTVTKGKASRRSASARRRRKSVPPSKDRHDNSMNDTNVSSEVDNIVSVAQGEPAQENSITNDLSAEKPNPATFPTVTGSITANGEQTEVLLIDFSDGTTETSVPPVAREQETKVVQEPEPTLVKEPEPTVVKEPESAVKEPVAVVTDGVNTTDSENNPIVEEEVKEPVYQDIDATLDLSSYTVEPRYGDKPNKKKLQAEIQDREKVKTKGQANKHLRSAKAKFIDDSMEEEFFSFDDSGCGDVTFEDADDELVDKDGENEDAADVNDKLDEPEVINAVDQPQIMDDREFKMIPEEIIRKDSDKLKDIEEMYGMCEKKDKKKKKERKTKPKKLTIPLTF